MHTWLRGRLKSTRYWKMKLLQKILHIATITVPR